VETEWKQKLARQIAETITLEVSFQSGNTYCFSAKSIVYPQIPYLRVKNNAHEINGLREHVSTTGSPPAFKSETITH